ncbi:MAG: hypothetical protein Q4F97_04900 [Bacteroidales bacterium]|nr:hypothetical protein [Bacteroidales bacterium]
MKKIVSLLFLIIIIAGCKGYKTDKQAEEAYAESDSTWIADTVYNDGLRYCYGTVWTGDRLLISNFGGDTFDPLDVSGKGYIMQLKDGKLSPYLNADELNSPKGMAVMDNLLFVADVNCILVFDMNNLNSKPQVIPFAPGEVFVSDLAVVNNWIYASVRDASLVYRGQIVDKANIAATDMEVYTVEVSGPNGIDIYNDSIFIASYPLNDSIGMRNSIYLDMNINTLNPQLYKLENLPGYYCGVAYDGKNKTLYYTDNIDGQLRSENMLNGNNKLLFPEKIMLSPQMLTVADGKLYVPDADVSRLYVFTVK